MSFICIYFAITFLIAFMGGLALWISGDYFDFDKVLSNKSDFFRSIFGFQVAAWDISEDFEINIIGKILIEFVVSFISFTYCVLAFSTLVALLFIKIIFRCFLFVFKKRKVEKWNEANSF